MINLQKLVENNRTFYLFPLGKKYNDRTAFLDATSLIKEAIRLDCQHGYSAENGPIFAIEALRARAYADFVDQYAVPDNLQRFDTTQYALYINALTDEQFNKEKLRHNV